MTIKLALIQDSFESNPKINNQKIINYMFEARELGAQIILTPELYLGSYFCKEQNDDNFSLAHELDSHPYVAEVQQVAKELKLVIPWSFFEKSGPEFYNSIAMIDADGEILDVYRKSHIPDGPGYQEKYYFRPGNTGFKVFKTAIAHIGVGICWDQWFPEAARIMTLKGAEILLYPTAIGSEPASPALSTKKPWQRVMLGHAVANMIPIAAANRIGNENGQIFYGSSFICDEFGEELINMQDTAGIKTADINIKKASQHRASFGFFRDRRVDLYKNLLR